MRCPLRCVRRTQSPVPLGTQRGNGAVTTDRNRPSIHLILDRWCCCRPGLQQVRRCSLDSRRVVSARSLVAAREVWMVAWRCCSERASGGRNLFIVLQACDAASTATADDADLLVCLLDRIVSLRSQAMMARSQRARTPVRHASSPPAFQQACSSSRIIHTVRRSVTWCAGVRSCILYTIDWLLP